MKRLLALALSLLMALTYAAPTMAETTEPAPAPIATQDFINAYNAMAGEHGLTME